MNFLTKGEFLQALKDYKYISDRIEILKKQYDDLEYLRYGKVKSPLDYYIVKYNNKDEPIRKIKGQGYTSSEEIADRNESLEKKMIETSKQIESLESRLKKTDDELTYFSLDMQKYLKDKYIKKRTFRQIINKYKLRYDEAGLYKYIHRTLDQLYGKEEAPL